MATRVHVEKQKIKRIIPLDDPNLLHHYDDMIELSKIFNHPIVETDLGTYRWMENYLMQYCLGRTDNDLHPYLLDLNDLMIKFLHHEFTLEEFMKFNMDTGYSLCGFGEIFCQREDVDSGLNLIDLVIANHKTLDSEYSKSWMEISTPFKL